MVFLKEGYKVWMKCFGNSFMKVLFLYGGLVVMYEYMEVFESFFL